MELEWQKYHLPSCMDFPLSFTNLTRTKKNCNRKTFLYSKLYYNDKIKKNGKIKLEWQKHYLATILYICASRFLLPKIKIAKGKLFQFSRR